MRGLGCAASAILGSWNKVVEASEFRRNFKVQKFWTHVLVFEGLRCYWLNWLCLISDQSSF